MKIHAFLPFALLIATACASVDDTSAGVTAPESIESYRSDFGLKPPPPLGSEETSISINIAGDEIVGEWQPGVSAVSAAAFPGFAGIVRGRYFANTPTRNAWIQFESFGGVIASPDARLQYNQMTGRTSGKGTLTSGGAVIDLSLFQFDAGTIFGVCGVGVNGSCAHFSFVYDGNKAGYGYVSPVGS